jgi:hypothetical protein
VPELPDIAAYMSALEPRILTLAAFDFPNGSLVLTEAGTKRRASLHVLRGEEALSAADPGGRSWPVTASWSGLAADIGGIGGSLPTGRAGDPSKKVAANPLRDFWTSPI